MKRGVDQEVIGGITYYFATACDGWPTGPCLTQAKALERVQAYERCEEVSQAAPGQASHAQMHALLETVNGDQAELVGQAIASGLHSEAWIRASAMLRELVGQGLVVDDVLHAGGTLVRRRMPKTSIPTRGA